MSILNNKGIFLGISLFFMLSIVQAQQTDSDRIFVRFDSISSKGKTLKLPIYRFNDLEHYANSERWNTVIDTAQIYAEEWNTSWFNSYMLKNLKVPDIIVFQDSTYAAPIDRKMVITSRYGMRRGRPHRGIDIDLHTGDQVKSILAGKVRYANYHRGHGKTVVIRHTNGLETVYAHLSEYHVEPNQWVEKGETIGKGGVSGNARGSHLHLEVRYKGVCIHPEYLFNFDESLSVTNPELVVTKKWISPRKHRSTRKSTMIFTTSLDQEIDITNSSETEKEKVYIVKRGDTLHAIANRYNIKVAEICKNNNIDYDQVLKIGQKIVIF